MNLNVFALLFHLFSSIVEDFALNSENEEFPNVFLKKHEEDEQVIGVLLCRHQVQIPVQQDEDNQETENQQDLGLDLEGEEESMELPSDSFEDDQEVDEVEVA